MPKAAVPLIGGDGGGRGSSVPRSILAQAAEAVTPDLNLELVVLVLPSQPQAHAQLREVATTLRSRLDVEVAVVTGGDSRPASVKAGVAAVSAHARSQNWEHKHTTVLIHDAARPLTPTRVFTKVLAAVEAGSGAVIPALPVTDTIKEVDQDVVTATLPRAQLRAVQTPQGFGLATLQNIVDHAASLSAEEASLLTDEAMVAEKLQHDVVVVPGDTHAMKITTETDLMTARALMSDQPPARPRVGIGHDIHALATDESTQLYLAGLHWPGERGLTGHSDGDVVAHACCDALFSAAGLGDMGQHFGADTIGTARTEMAGVSGVWLLVEAARITRAAGFEIGNIAVQLVGARPKFNPRRAEAEQALSQAAGAEVSIAATTTDGLGFIGRGEGVAATATALVYPQ